jgi:hypothetical protein
MIGDETINGKKVFNVDFLDFCKFVTRTERRTKFSLENEALMEHIVKTRYSRKFIMKYDGLIIDAELASGESNK